MEDERDGKDVKEAQPKEEKVFTVDEAASIAGCDRATIYRLIADGWLSRPKGTSKKETGGRVTQESLYKLLIVNRLSHLDKKTLRILQKDREVFEKSESQSTPEIRFSIGKGGCKAPGKTDPSPYPLPQGEGKQQRLHHAFTERHQFSFGWRARQLAPGDPALQDDLMQEMSLAVLEYERPASFEFLFELAGNRAIDYLRYEAWHGKLSLSLARHASDSFAEKITSLNLFIDELLQRGVPAAWIEEVIGGRLEMM